MARRSLRPHLNQIRTWVRQGRTDAWVAHQLEVTVQQIQQFKRENELAPADDAFEDPTGYPEEVDLRAEDDALIAAELEAAEAAAAEAERIRAEEEAERARIEAEAARARAAEEGEPATAEDDDDGGEDRPAGRRRGRRGGRSRRGARPGQPLEGTFDHGEEGYGLWLDPAVQENPVYAEHWAGHRPVLVTVEEDQIVIRRAGVEED